MGMRYAFAKALKTARKSNHLTQEDFSIVSSRTYLSALERGQKSPTLDKVDALSKTIGIHLLTLIALTCLHRENLDNPEKLLEQVRRELERLLHE